MSALSLTREQVRAFQLMLEEYAERLQSVVRSGFANRAQRETYALVKGVLRRLSLDMAWSIRTGVELTTDRVGRAYAEAALRAIRQIAPGAVDPVIMRGIGARAAQAVLSRGPLASALRSIRTETADIATGIIQRAVLRGATPTQLARELRLFMVGAERLDPDALLDRRRVGYKTLQLLGYEPTPENLRIVRAQTGQVAAKAELVARTEIMAAQHETHVQGAIESPAVRAVQWRTSSRHVLPDVCDVLAREDLYGLGAGMYDPRLVPPRPHPRCLCFTQDVLVDNPAQLERLIRGRGPIPTRRASVEDITNAYEFSPSQQRQLESTLFIAEKAAEVRAA